MSRGVIAYIDQSALRHNFQCVRRIVGVETKILAMIKANAYGHGLIESALTLSSADGFGVATLDSAISLRQQGVQSPIVLMQGFLTVSELEDCLKYHLTPVIHHLHQIECLSRYPLQRPLSYWLKIDTGMHRLGIEERDFDVALGMLRHHRFLDQSPVMMTHFACADEACEDGTVDQINLFSRLLKSLSHQRSACNSAAILAYPRAHYDWVRPGIMLYGVSPFSNQVASDYNLKPVMTLVARLIAVRQQKKSDRIGYGGTFRCPRDMIVGVVNIGYGDGYPRSVEPGTPVLIHGEACPILGRVSMDMMTVDLTALASRPEVGTEVVLWGRGLPVEVVARGAGTIGYELLIQLTRRVRFVHSTPTACH